MLVVTTTMGMVDGVHTNTLNLRPVGSLSLVEMELVSCLQDRLFSSSSSSDQTDGGSAGSREGLSGSGWESNSSLGAIVRLTDDGGIAAGGSSESSSISFISLDVANDGTFSNFSKGKYVSDCDVSAGSAVDVLTSVGSFSSEEVLFSSFISIGVSEGDFSEGSSSSGVVEDLFNDTSNVSVSFGVIQTTISSSTKSVMLVSLENTIGSSFSL